MIQGNRSSSEQLTVVNKTSENCSFCLLISSLHTPSVFVWDRKNYCSLTSSTKVFSSSADGRMCDWMSSGPITSSSCLCSRRQGFDLAGRMSGETHWFGFFQAVMRSVLLKSALAPLKHLQLNGATFDSLVPVEDKSPIFFLFFCFPYHFMKLLSSSGGVRISSVCFHVPHNSVQTGTLITDYTHGRLYI